MYGDLIGFTFISQSKLYPYNEKVGAIWNQLTQIDGRRFPAGGWFNTAAVTAYWCTMIQIGRLDQELRSNSKFRRQNLVPPSFSNLICSPILEKQSELNLKALDYDPIWESKYLVPTIYDDRGDVIKDTIEYNIFK